MRAVWACAIASTLGCGTKVEPIVCASNDDCGEAYFCQTRSERCLRLVCEAEGECAEGYECAVDIQRCLSLSGDGGADATFCDRDGDGVDGAHCEGTDCDDDDKGRFPGNTESCNGKDDDCDDETLDGTDADGDHYCAEGGPHACCTGVEADCCDSDPDAYPGQTAWFTLDDGETSCGGWDYNCSGTEERELVNSAACSCDPCVGIDGWEVVIPGCGARGDFAVCGELACGANDCPLTSTSVLQGCH